MSSGCYFQKEDTIDHFRLDRNVDLIKRVLDRDSEVECRRQIKNAKADPPTVYVLNLLTHSYANKAGIIQEQSYKLAKKLMGLIVELGDCKQVNEALYNFVPLLKERPSYLLAELFYKFEKYELAKAEFLSLLKFS